MSESVPRPSWMPDNCTCDHLATDHARSRAGFPHPETYGPCLRCECRLFMKAEMSEACERHDPSPSVTCPACGVPTVEIPDDGILPTATAGLE